MRVNISEITKVEGASMDLEFNQVISELEGTAEGFSFSKPVCFKGQLANTGGIIKLSGHLTVEYSTGCYRCLNEVNGKVDVDIRENFVNTSSKADDETYEYEGNYIELDGALKDNIILNLPMKQACSEECRGLCPKCGANLNEGECTCKDDYINPQMQVLENYFKN